MLGNGGRARLRGALHLDHTTVPVDVGVLVDVQGDDALHVHVSLSDLTATDVARASTERATQLTARERKVVSLIGMGKGTDEIARLLFITPHTVRTHVRNAMSKVGAHTRAELTAIVLRAGEIDDLPRDSGSRRPPS
jgi:DNA-binding CsgD family transcriptional regulator